MTHAVSFLGIHKTEPEILLDSHWHFICSVNTLKEFARVEMKVEILALLQKASASFFT
jgi:hypothetical protein